MNQQAQPWKLDGAPQQSLVPDRGMLVTGQSHR